MNLEIDMLEKFFAAALSVAVLALPAHAQDQQGQGNAEGVPEEVLGGTELFVQLGPVLGVFAAGALAAGGGGGGGGSPTSTSTTSTSTTGTTN